MTTFVVPIPERSAGSLIYGSTKNDRFAVVFLTPDSESKDDICRPDSRTLGRLADTREYQKADTIVSAFVIPTENQKMTFVVPIPVRSTGSPIYGGIKQSGKQENYYVEIVKCEKYIFKKADKYYIITSRMAGELGKNGAEAGNFGGIPIRFDNLSNVISLQILSAML